jgi:hypothetical protein
VKLARFLAHVDALAGPVLATVNGRVAAELIVGFRATFTASIPASVPVLVKRTRLTDGMRWHNASAN